LIKSFEFENKKEAYSLEMKIKKRGCRRFLNENSSLKKGQFLHRAGLVNQTQ